jgi:AcrR family transcriptional regulator
MARKSGSSAEKTAPLVRAAAQALFAAHGFAAVSMRRIAAEVGVQAGALYLYTPDKQSLLFDLMQGHMQELLAAWDGLRTADMSAPARLETFVRFHIRFHLERSDAVFIAYMELRNLTPDNFAVIEALRRRYETVLQDILKDGASAGDFALTDSKLTTMAIIAMLNGVNTWFRDGGRLSQDRVVEIYLDMVRKAVSPG